MQSPQADQLVAAYRQSQVSLAEKAAAYVVARWAAEFVPGKSITAAQAAWYASVIPLIMQARARQVAPARAFYQALRVLETGDRKVFRPPNPPAFDPEILRISLYYTGIKDIQETRPDVMQKKIEGSVKRHVLNGGRDTIATAQQADPVAVGYYRDTDGDPCFFCAMLASRGIVYKEESFDESDPRFEGDGKAKVHDFCACVNRPAWSRDIVLPEVNLRAFDTWMSLTGFDSKGRPIDSANEFRQRWEGRYEQKMADLTQ